MQHSCLTRGARHPPHHNHSYSADDAVGEVGTAVTAAVQCGYRLIDCAMGYGNQREIGNAVSKLIKVRCAHKHANAHTSPSFSSERVQGQLCALETWAPCVLVSCVTSAECHCDALAVGGSPASGPVCRVQAAQHTPLVGGRRLTLPRGPGADACRPPA